jgi:hypothetical protein
MPMYGPQSSDLANALQADRHRYAAQVSRERSERSSRPSTAGAGSGQVVAIFAAAIANARSALARPRPSPSIQ